LLFWLILGVLAYVNYRLNHQFQIDASWLALGLAPVIIWLLTTQQLSEFSGFGLGFKRCHKHLPLFRSILPPFVTEWQFCHGPSSDFRESDPFLKWIGFHY